VVVKLSIGTFYEQQVVTETSVARLGYILMVLISKVLSGLSTFLKSPSVAKIPIRF
jgi:hypothetical protein